ncbi:MAG: GYF domain-containing protein [Opitutales bacterium]|nr:GYF domain-containing protein [Opitutales bacterium]
MNIFVSRNGQTFGPYPKEQAKQYLEAGQLLASDYALIEGTSEWKNLAGLLSSPPLPENSQANSGIDYSANSQVSHENVTPVAQEKVRSSVKPRSTKQSLKTKATNQVQTVYVAQKKSFIGRLFSIVMVFTFMMLLAIGGIVGAYFAMPTTMGPLLSKFGLPMDVLLANTQVGAIAIEKATMSEPQAADEVSLDPESFRSLQNLGVRILPMENEKGLQIIAPADPPMEDQELANLLPIANHVVSLDLTNSKITDQGVSHILKLVNLRKLNMEGAVGITSVGASQLKSLAKLEHLNLINVKLEDSIIDSLLNLESLREVYLFKTGISEEAIKRLKSERPKMFVNAG